LKELKDNGRRRPLNPMGAKFGEKNNE